MSNNKEILNAALRSDFYTFIQKAFKEIDDSQKFKSNWHLELICDKLEQCYRGDIKRLIINIPPRNLKSHCASICLPAFILGHNPNARIICVSYSQDLADKLSRKTKKLMESDFYKNVFKTRLGDKQTEGEFETTKNGFRYATSVMGSLTGIGGNYIIIDDPMKADDASSETIRNSVNQWYSNTLASRLDAPKEGVIILVMQRLHMDDLTGYLIKQGGWELLSLPAIAENDENFILSDDRVVGRKAGEALNPEHEPLEILERKKKLDDGAYNFSAQYQQRPIPETGNVLDFELFQYYDDLPSSGRIVQSWDIALKDGVKNDYSVCITSLFDGEKYFILDVFREKLDFPYLIDKIQELKQAFHASDIIIEESSVTLHLLQHLEKQGLFVIKYRPVGSKIIRANNASLPLRAGKIFLKRDASWLECFKTEIISFPTGRHDDQVDAFTQLVGATIYIPSSTSSAIGPSKYDTQKQLQYLQNRERVKHKQTPNKSSYTYQRGLLRRF